MTLQTVQNGTPKPFCNQSHSQNGTTPGGSGQMEERIHLKNNSRKNAPPITVGTDDPLRRKLARKNPASHVVSFTSAESRSTFVDRQREMISSTVDTGYDRGDVEHKRTTDGRRGTGTVGGRDIPPSTRRQIMLESPVRPKA